MPAITKTGSEILVFSDTSSEMVDPVLATLDNGGFVVTWSFSFVGANINAQRYDSSGAPVGEEFTVNTDIDYIWKVSPAIAGLDDGGFIISWDSYGQDASEYGVYAQRYDANGDAAGGEFLVNTTTENHQWGSDVTGLSGGGFVITWNTYFQDGDAAGVSGRVFDASGVAVGAEFQINTYTTDSQQGSEVASLTDGGFVVTWTSENQDEVSSGDPDNGYGIFAQRYDASGVKVGGEFQVNTTTANDQVFSEVTGLSGGGFVMTWGSYNLDGTRYDVFARMYAADGSAIGDEFPVSAAVAGRQECVRFCCR